MLQEEESRAKKKISDTRKKTAEIRQRMENNDL
jgi:ABC-type Fe3+-hydroxamate transport system substrate-binding protein